MKKLLCVIFVLAAVSVYSQDVTVFQINAKWNESNNYDTKGLKNCVIKFGFLKDQPKDIQKSISAVPVIAILKDGKVKMQYVADLSFKIQATREEMQKVINTLNSN